MHQEVEMNFDDYSKLLASGMLWELYPNGVKVTKPTKKYYEEPEDPNVARVLESYLDRAEEGMKKYQVTTERTDIDLLGWLNHLQEELMDATIYLERVKREFDT